MFLAGLFFAAFARSLASPVPIAVPGSTIPSPVCVVAAAITASRCDPTRTRTIYDILYSCIGVILLCTYISIHHNIPDQSDSWAKATWLKIRTTLYALIAPEMVIMWVIRQWIMAREIARENRYRGWTATHGFFIQMGGLVRCKKVDGRIICEVVCPLPYHRHTDWKNLQIPSIPEKEIQDHGKGDLLAKAVVVIQTTWFVAQCIARRVQDLVLTEIELVTLAFATLNVITYALWWNKPLNIGYPIYFDEKGVRVDGPLATVGEPEDNEGQVEEWKGTWYSRVWRSVKEYVAGWDEACRSAWRSVKESWREYADDYGISALIVTPFAAVFRPLLNMMLDEAVMNRPASVHPFYAAAMSSNDEDMAIMYGSAIGLIFGGIHLIGWNFQFPTHTELWLWRASSLVLTVVPLFLVIGVVIYSKANDNTTFRLTGFVGAPLYFAARIILLSLHSSLFASYQILHIKMSDGRNIFPIYSSFCWCVHFSPHEMCQSNTPLAFVSSYFVFLLCDSFPSARLDLRRTCKFCASSSDVRPILLSYYYR
ncbi:hypothetical protein AX16_007926 [Volvariella volvacea WC 439]|nr:hypothetical protein AX16_007926 [Volvariella volvacea WC 439]